MNKVDAMREGAAAAELHAMRQSLALAKAKVEELEKRIRTSNEKIREAFARVGFCCSNNPTPEEIQNGLAFMEAFNVRSRQLAENIVATLGFGTKADRDAAKKEANRSR